METPTKVPLQVWAAAGLAIVLAVVHTAVGVLMYSLGCGGVNVLPTRHHLDALLVGIGLYPLFCLPWALFVVISAVQLLRRTARARRRLEVTAWVYVAWVGALGFIQDLVGLPLGPRLAVVLGLPWLATILLLRSVPVRRAMLDEQPGAPSREQVWLRVRVAILAVGIAYGLVLMGRYIYAIVMFAYHVPLLFLLLPTAWLIVILTCYLYDRWRRGRT